MIYRRTTWYNAYFFFGILEHILRILIIDIEVCLLGIYLSGHAQLRKNKPALCVTRSAFTHRWEPNWIKKYSINNYCRFCDNITCKSVGDANHVSKKRQVFRSAKNLFNTFNLEDIMKCLFSDIHFLLLIKSK